MDTLKMLFLILWVLTNSLLAILGMAEAEILSRSKMFLTIGCYFILDIISIYFIYDTIYKRGS